ncbi:L-rhamnose-binding lectin CSL1-like [Phyllopteryx taeniolatus]|uniref:L-rhamnose-binding lectin CSL1-like n=1 Tax=Phyllopteryx taeniolatus TaxID=161469 RepID=UPI002AD3BE68|nr:L-rhamnose-binding lectin CSL1-like [Phyllopteryx taeniolatus]XP_061625259.1 L-rhamnose-binding lectin CSL1-like [Phyllopteryx taeniolatus]XP_061625261.1 L-rhamnose-binding lectin CSL1-like [Phyllopteryx taeniolatus]
MLTLAPSLDACVKDAAIMFRMLALALVSALYFLSHTTEGEVVYACHNDTAVMSCESGFKIHLDHILYKVGVGTRCGEGKHHPDDGEGVFCSFPWAEMVVEDLCGNRRSCEVPVTEVVFGEYPCKENTRYLEVAYTCVAQAPPPPPPAPAKADCDDSTA